MARRPHQILLGALIVVCMGTVSCDSEAGVDGDEPACDQAVDITLDCAPLYLPTTFDKVFTTTLVPGCAIGGSSCHSPQGAKGGLVFDADAPDAAWASLLEGDGGTPRVIGGAPECSPLVHRLVSEDAALQMPPGIPLSEPELCAVLHWIRDGALR